VRSEIPLLQILSFECDTVHSGKGLPIFPVCNVEIKCLFERLLLIYVACKVKVMY
jgi:hypothetical protein